MKNLKVIIQKVLIIFFIINEELLSEKNIFNIFVKKYNKFYSSNCKCNIDNNNKYSTKKIKFEIKAFPDFLILLFVLDYANFLNKSNNIYDILEYELFLGLDIVYRLKNLVTLPFKDHYGTVIFNPTGNLINSKFKSNLIYFHDSLKNNGNIKECSNNEDWKGNGSPYIAIYKKN